MEERRKWKTVDTRKCHNCKGVGFVEAGEIKSKCYYCNGAGTRTSYYGADKY